MRKTEHRQDTHVNEHSRQYAPFMFVYSGGTHTRSMIVLYNHDVYKRIFGQN